MSQLPAHSVLHAAAVFPEPVPGAPYTTRSMAHLALGQALRSVAEFACAMAPIGARPAPCYGGALLADALALREMVDHVVVTAVLTEREDGTSWTELGHTTGESDTWARAQWGDDERIWRSDLDASHPASQPTSRDRNINGAGEDTGAYLDADGIGANTAGWSGSASDSADPDVAADPAAVANALDRWVRRHLDPSALDPGPTPVTACMERMDPLRELLHLAARTQHLTAAGPDSAPALAATYERMAVVSEAITAGCVDPEHDTEQDGAALDYRRRAAAVRAQARIGDHAGPPDWLRGPDT